MLHIIPQINTAVLTESCSVHKELKEEERFFRFDFRGIDFLGMHKLYLRLDRVLQPSLHKKCRTKLFLGE